ncbi:MAG: glycerophosphoryl diester phosphodiesterase membrane domain-containing protein, partial [Methyloligellaceae bacterium]
MRTPLLSVVRTLSAGLKPVIVFGVAFHVFGVLILTPLFAVLLRGLIGVSGRMAVSNADLAAYFLTPVGLAWLVVFATTELMLLLGQQAGFLQIARAVRAGSSLSLVQVGTATIGCLPRLFGMALIQSLVVLGLLALFGFVLAAIYWLLLSGADINYHLAERSAGFWMALGLVAPATAALLGALILIFTRWILALPICVFEGGTWRGPLRQSWKATRAHVRPIGILLIGWFAGASGLLVLAAV